MSTAKSQWLLYAILSGACAALNGVFARLTTTHLTTSIATKTAQLIGQDEPSYYIEILVRSAFFLLNMLFNAIMWTLFTRALTLSSSTVRVSVINTSANFVVTALLGGGVFGEELPGMISVMLIVRVDDADWDVGLWWLGAGLLVTGSVIIGRRDESPAEDGKPGAGGKEGLKRDEAGGTGDAAAGEGEASAINSNTTRRRKPA